MPGARAAAGERFEELVDTGDGALAGGAAVAPQRAEPQVLVDRELGDDAAAVGDQRDAAAGAVLGADAREVGAVEADASGCRAGTSPASARSRVVLPAPFAPSTATISPGRMSKLTPCSTGSPPYPTVRPVDRERSDGRRRHGGHAVAFTPR